MTTAGTGRSIRVPLSRSQRNIYNGVVQDGDPALYLIGRRYRFQPLGLPALLSALDATIRANPVHLCVLEPGGEDGYPVLAPRLRVDELIRVCTDDATDTAAQLKATWAPGLLGVPLVRYIVRTDDDGAVCGLDAYCHHLLLDGGGTAIIEGHLGGYLSGDAEFISSAEGLRSLEQAHRREAALIDDALQRLTAAATVELRADAENHRRADSRPPGHAARARSAWIGARAAGQEDARHPPQPFAVVETDAGAGGEDGVPDAEGRGEVAQGGAEAPESRPVEGAEAQLHPPAAGQVGGQRLQPCHGIEARRLDAHAPNLELVVVATEIEQFALPIPGNQIARAVQPHLEFGVVDEFLVRRLRLNMIAARQSIASQAQFPLLPVTCQLPMLV